MKSPVDEINAAFDGVERPKELTLHVAEEHDNYDYSNDATHRANDYAGRWQDIPDEHLLRCHWGLSHLGADGLPYYLPAAMTWALKNFRDTNELLVDWTIYQLNPHLDDKALAEHYDSRFQLFTSTQWFACRAFLEYLLYEDPEGNIIDAVVAKKALAGVEAKINSEEDAPSDSNKHAF
jgi:hypothetical protein